MSRDTGRTWSACAGENSRTRTSYGLPLSPSFNTDDTVLFGVETADGVGGAWISTDGGTSARALGIASENTGNALAFSPAFATDHTFAVGLGADGVFMTTDAGATFTRSYSGTVTSLLFSPLYGATHELFVGTSGKGLQMVNTAQAPYRQLR